MLTKLLYSVVSDLGSDFFPAMNIRQDGRLNVHQRLDGLCVRWKTQRQTVAGRLASAAVALRFEWRTGTSFYLN